MNRRAVKNLSLALATVFVSSLAQAGDLLQRITQEKQITVARPSTICSNSRTACARVANWCWKP